MRYISVFSGIEAASCALDGMGWEAVAFSEIDPFPCAVLRAHFPEVPNLGDITKIDWSPYRGSIDLVVGGSPCQSFSVAGGRESLDGESRLMFEYIRCVEESSPRWMCWENVPGVLSTRDNAYGQLLGALHDLGYSLAWRVLDAQYFGTPQRRRRVYLVGYFGAGGPPAAVLFEPESMRWNIAKGGGKRKGASRKVELGVEPRGGICMSTGQANAEITVGICPTLTGAHEHPIVIDRASFNQGKGAQYNPHIEEADVMDPLVARGPHAVLGPVDDMVRRITPLECERLQGFPDGWTDVEFNGRPAFDTHRYRALGNSMAVPVMRWIFTRIERVDGMLVEEGKRHGR